MSYGTIPAEVGAILMRQAKLLQAGGASLACAGLELTAAGALTSALDWLDMVCRVVEAIVPAGSYSREDVWEAIEGFDGDATDMDSMGTLWGIVLGLIHGELTIEEWAEVVYPRIVDIPATVYCAVREGRAVLGGGWAPGTAVWRSAGYLPGRAPPTA